MTSLLERPLDTGHPVLVGLGEIEEALDRMLTGAATPLTGDYAMAVTRLERISRRVEAVKLKLLAGADRAGTAADGGFTGTESWVARHTTVSRTTAAREVILAKELMSGHDATATALDEGLVSPAHAAVIVRADQQLPAGVSEAQRRIVEEALVHKAQRFDPDQLRRIARRAIEAVEPDQIAVDAHENELLRTEEEAARDRARLSFHDNGDGTVTGHFTVPALAAGILTKVIDSMTAPRRMRERESSSLDWAHRRGLAFAEVLEHLPTDHLHPKSAATVVVTIDHAVLDTALKAAHLDTGHTITAGEARRLACGAGLIPAVLGTGSVALDLGREARLFSEAQRVANGLQHSSCAADGCERPFAWCELHHRKPWHLGGTTNLRDAVPLCHYHHQRMHDHAFTHRYHSDGSIRFSGRT
ncbi:MAG: endonuclease [Marmoricola sp.]|nr:endonuclease [Marmoricola sp.]